MKLRSSRTARPRAAGNRAIRDWLHEAAACLSEASRPLPKPPRAELQSTYAAILAARQHLEQAQPEPLEALQMQSLEAVGSMLAHDLHNLSLRLALLSQNLEQFYGDPTFLQSAKRVLDDTVERMRGLVANFRERRESVIVKIPTDVNDVIHTVVRNGRLDQLEGIEVGTDYGAARRIWADPFFLANAIQVLVENAVEAMPEGGRLEVVTRSRPGRKGKVEILIRDTGIGMTREFIERELFKPFRSGKGRGLGLGMFVCRQIIELHEGEIRVESQPAVGTLVHLKFPPAPEAK